MSENPPARLCTRCRQPLPKDVTFCVGCGAQNDADSIYAKQVGFEQQREDRLTWLRIRMAFASIFRIFR